MALSLGRSVVLDDPIAFVNCLIVAFLISVFSEYFVMKEMLADLDNSIIRKVACKANLVSYSLLMVLNIGYLGFAITGAS